jgi:biopolymer transport protein ExbD
MASSKLRQSASAGDDDCKLDMSPMIDMVFLLLLFFLVNATVIVVKMDANVTVPVAVNSKKAEDGNGRIVINVRESGDFYDESGNVKLESDDDITDLVKEEKERNDRLGYKSKLHLRGDKEAVFKYSRQVIRAAAKAQVDQVVFAVFVTDK